MKKDEINQLNKINSIPVLNISYQKDAIEKNISLFDLRPAFTILTENINTMIDNQHDNLKGLKTLLNSLHVDWPENFFYSSLIPRIKKAAEKYGKAELGINFTNAMITIRKLYDGIDIPSPDDKELTEEYKDKYLSLIRDIISDHILKIDAVIEGILKKEESKKRKICKNINHEENWVKRICIKEGKDKNAEEQGLVPPKV